MTDLAIVVFVAVLVFAATRITALGDALGRAIRGGGSAPADGSPPRRDGPEKPPT